MDRSADPAPEQQQSFMNWNPIAILGLLVLCVLSCNSQSPAEEAVVLPKAFTNDIPTPSDSSELIKATQRPESAEATYQCEIEPSAMFQSMQQAFVNAGWEQTLSFPIGRSKDGLLNFEKPDGRRVACSIEPSDQGQVTVSISILTGK